MQLLVVEMSTYEYVAILFFAAFAIFVPVSFLISSKLLRKNSPGNPVKNAPYESAETSIGSGRDIDNEYLPFFALFVAFEIIGMLVLLWSLVTRQLGYGANLLVIGLTIVSMAFALIGYRFTIDKNV